MNNLRCWCQRQLATASMAKRFVSSTASKQPERLSTSDTLAMLKSQGSLYATVQLMGRRYLVTKGDVLTVPRLKDLSTGQTIALTRILEVGSRDYTLRPSSISHSPVVQAGEILRPVTAHNVDLSLRNGSFSEGQQKRQEDRWRANPAKRQPRRVPKDWQRHPDALPFLSENVVKASATVIEHTKGAMFEVEKFKKRKGYRRHLRFKLGWTKLRVNDIQLP